MNLTSTTDLFDNLSPCVKVCVWNTAKLHSKTVHHPTSIQTPKPACQNHLQSIPTYSASKSRPSNRSGQATVRTVGQCPLLATVAINVRTIHDQGTPSPNCMPNPITYYVSPFTAQEDRAGLCWCICIITILIIQTPNIVRSIVNH